MSLAPTISILTLVLTAAAALAAPPVRPGVQWTAVPQFTDEFNAPQIDTKKWTLNCGTWLGREPGMFTPGNAVTKDGAAQISLKAEAPPKPAPGYQDYTCGVLRSMHRVRYGFFEIRAKAGRSRGSSAFWFYHDAPDMWTEIDVFEISAAHPEWGNRVHMDAPVLRYPGLQGELHFREIWQAPWNPADDWHVYAMEWDAEALRWYVDGTMVRQLPNTHWKTQALHLVLDTETMPAWFGLPDKSSLPAEFNVDYVRAWQKTATTAALATQRSATAASAAAAKPAATASETPKPALPASRAPATPGQQPAGAKPAVSHPPAAAEKASGE